MCSSLGDTILKLVCGSGSKSYAQCYGGHQFGSWAGQLGDGRAISLGQTTGTDGNVWELQLKVRSVFVGLLHAANYMLQY